jgi:transcriptional regulator with XRE-family HTH domain
MEQNQYSALGDAIRSARRKRDMSQGALADAVGVAASMMSMIESGKARPSPQTCDIIAVQLDVDPNELRRLAGHPGIDLDVIRRVAEFSEAGQEAKAKLSPKVLQAIRKLLRLSEHDLTIVVRQLEAFPDETTDPADTSDAHGPGHVEKGATRRRAKNHR